jgi:hypothetical protein
MTDAQIELELMRREIARLREETARNSTVAQEGGGGGGPREPGMPDERIGRLEGALDGLRHAQNLTVGAVGLLAAMGAILTAIVIGFGIYELQRIDQLSDRVADLPGKISTDLRDLTKTLADTITAARQPAPLPQLAPQPEQKPPAPMFQKHEK